MAILMPTTERISAFLALEKTRAHAYRRDLWIAGGLFFMVILAATFTLLLTEWNARSVWLMGVFLILSAVGFVMAWTRHAITRHSVELLKMLLLP